MSPKPVVLHFILDGYSPYNEDDYYGTFEDSVPEGYPRLFCRRRIPNTGDHPCSPDMWTRSYSHVQFSDIMEEDDFRVSVGNKIRRVGSENFIWNKLSKLGIPSWIYPYGQYYHSVEHNMLNESSSLVNGVVKKYSTRNGYYIDGGVFKHYRSPIGVYYGLHEVTRPTYFKGTVMEDYNTQLLDPTPEFLEEATENLYHHLNNRFCEYLEVNEELFDKEILPHLQSKSEVLKDGGYVHIGLVESDVPMHFAVVYPDIMQRVTHYLSSIIKKAVSIVNPDVVIITGDHGMVAINEWVDGKSLRKKLYDVSYKGITKRAMRAACQYFPIYNEHSREHGAVIYAKNNEFLDEFFHEYLESDESLHFDLYNFILGICGKERSSI